MVRVELERNREKERTGTGKKRCWKVGDYLLDSEPSVQFTLSRTLTTTNATLNS